jgi:hypothetical protein
MGSAWIITQEGTRHKTEVIGILSARNSPDKIKAYIEFIYALFHCNAEEHMSAARYNKPWNPYEAEYNRTNTGVRVQSTIFCGHNPYLVARLARGISLQQEEPPRLQWTEPDRIEITGTKITRTPGIKMEALVSLPFRFAPEAE